MLLIGIMYFFSMAENLKMGYKSVSNKEGNLFCQTSPWLVWEMKIQPLRRADILQLQSFQFKAA